MRFLIIVSLSCCVGCAAVQTEVAVTYQHGGTTVTTSFRR